jgi:hypothetical protein
MIMLETSQALVYCSVMLWYVSRYSNQLKELFPSFSLEKISNFELHGILKRDAFGLVSRSYSAEAVGKQRHLQN